MNMSGNAKGEIAYELGKNLYVNLTNRCTSSCTFCIRNFAKKSFLGHNLILEKEPSVEEAVREIESKLGKSKEVVFCGFGEPLVRLDDVLEITRRIRSRFPNIKIRVNTNGHAYLMHPGRNVPEELKEAGVSKISISLNAESAEKYAEICKPLFGKKTYASILKFIEDCARILETEATIVDIWQVDRQKCEQMARKLGAKFRAREFGTS